MLGAGGRCTTKKVAHYKKRWCITKKLVPETKYKNQCYFRPLGGGCPVVDLRGVPRTHTPLGPISFIFRQFSGKIWPNNRFAPTPWKLTPPAPPVWEILDPPLLPHLGNPETVIHFVGERCRKTFVAVFQKTKWNSFVSLKKLSYKIFPITISNLWECVAPGTAEWVLLWDGSVMTDDFCVDKWFYVVWMVLYWFRWLCCCISEGFFCSKECCWCVTWWCNTCIAWSITILLDWIASLGKKRNK